MKRILVGATAALLAVSVISSAGADTVRKTDPQGDTDPRYSDPADIRSATAGHTRTGKLKHTIVLWNRVTKSHRPRVNIVTNSADNTCSDTSRDGELLIVGDPGGKIMSNCGGASAVLESYITKRPNKHTIIYIFSKKTLAHYDYSSPVDRYFWAVEAPGDDAPNKSKVFLPEFDAWGVKHQL